MERESNCNMFNDAKSMRLAQNWENSLDQNDPFESALSSMVSSPTASNATNNINGENIVLRELIGRLGSISPFNGNGNSTSCYSTPLSSPPKLHLLSNIEREERESEGGNNNNYFLSLPTLAPFSADPAFAERAPRFSSFATARVSGSQNGNGDSRENLTVSEAQIPNSRKRKSGAPKGKVKGTVAAWDELRGKRTKSQEVIEKEKEKEKDRKQSKDDSEPQKDYIHVRARRGQATDAHSLAERVRREKISERMKALQDLVPGCNKVTGKAVMLDEIINYVQSLQRQVEFLSMKLATVNPRMDISMEALLSKDMFQSLPHSHMYPSETYPSQSHPNNNVGAASLGRNQDLQLPPIDNYGNASSQVSSFWEDDLHSIVQMGLGTQSFQGIVPTTQMKVEL